MAAPTIRDELRELHDAYVWEVNAAVGRDEDELTERLSDEFTDRALRLMLTPRRAGG
jgi:hypothetical protein